MTAKPDTVLHAQSLDLDQTEEDEIDYFYDDQNNYLKLRQERGDMPNPKHNQVVDYLKQTLQWHYHLEGYQIDREVNFFETADKKETPLYPDVFVLKTNQEIPQERGYRLGVDGPAPAVIFEIVSNKTVKTDLEEKPTRYESWGVKEYFVYDPRSRIRKRKEPILKGWRLVGRRYEELKLEENRRMWSEELESWLVVDGKSIWLEDRLGQRWLNEGEEEKAERQAAERREALERRAKEAAMRREIAERQSKEAALQRETAERQAKEIAMQREAIERQAKEIAMQRETAERQSKEAALQRETAERQAKEAERQAKEAALQREETERQAKEIAMQRETAERQAKELLQRQLEEMAAKLEGLENK